MEGEGQQARVLHDDWLALNFFVLGFLMLMQGPLGALVVTLVA